MKALTVVRIHDRELSASRLKVGRLVRDENIARFDSWDADYGAREQLMKPAVLQSAVAGFDSLAPYQQSARPSGREEHGLYLCELRSIRSGRTNASGWSG